jgi:hypothetical protein
VGAPRTLRTSDGAVVLSAVSGQQLKRALAATGLAARADELKAAPDPTSMTERFYDLSMSAQISVSAVMTSSLTVL